LSVCDKIVCDKMIQECPHIKYLQWRKYNQMQSLNEICDIQKNEK